MNDKLRFIVPHGWKIALTAILTTVACGVPCLGALTFESDFDDRAVKYVMKDAARMVKGFDGVIELRKDPSMEYRQWRFFSEGGDRLTVYGADEQGVIYGVYTFLEKHMGCRWYAPDTEKTVNLRGWKFPKIDERGKCAFFHYHVGHGRTDLVNPAWLLRNKQTECAAYSVGVNQGSPCGSHTFPHYAAAIRKRHPEMFGNRPSAAKGKPCQTLCLTDPKMRELVAEQMIRYIESDRKASAKYPHYRQKDVYDLAPADGTSGVECMCDGCRTMMEREGSYSGPNIDFCNAVAEIVNRKYPEIQVRTLAYAYIVDPPKTKVADENVPVRFCKAYVFQPLVPSSPHAADFLKWRRHAKRLSVWSYWRTYRGQMYPHVKPRRDMEAELRFCADNRVWHYYAEQEDATRRSFAMLQHWLFLKLCENPYQPVKPLSDEFMAAYYGKAAPVMDRYLSYIESRQCENQTYLDREFFEKANAWLDEAERLAAGDARSLLHIGWERVVVDRSMYDRLGALQKAGYRFDAQKVSSRFLPNALAVMKAWVRGNTAIPKAKHAAMAEALRMESSLYSRYPIPLPEIFDGLEVDTLEWNQLPLVLGKFKYVSDPDAAAGTAFTPVGKEYRFPYELGFYNSQRKEGEYTFVYAEDIPSDEKFHQYRIGRAVIVKPLYTYFHNTWNPRTYMRTLGIIPEERDIWVSAKFTGPAFVPGSTNENAALFDRVFLVKGTLLNGYSVPDPAKALVSGADSGEVTAEKGLWNSPSLGTSDALQGDLYVRGRVNYRNISPSAFPRIGLGAVDADGRTVFRISGVTLYPGNEDGKRFETVFTKRRIENRIRRRHGKITPPCRLYITVSVSEETPETVVRVSELEVIPVTKKDIER